VRLVATASLWRAGLRGEAVERLAAEGDGVAAVGLVEPLRVGNAMLCPQGVMGNAVAPKRSVLATASLWWAAMRGEASRGGRSRGGMAERGALRHARWLRRYV
jgi:hypothetical protein